MPPFQQSWWRPVSDTEDILYVLMYIFVHTLCTYIHTHKCTYLCILVRRMHILKTKMHTCILWRQLQLYDHFSNIVVGCINRLRMYTYYNMYCNVPKDFLSLTLCFSVHIFTYFRSLCILVRWLLCIPYSGNYNYIMLSSIVVHASIYVAALPMCYCWQRWHDRNTYVSYTIGMTIVIRQSYIHLSAKMV